MWESVGQGALKAANDSTQQCASVRQHKHTQRHMQTHTDTKTYAHTNTHYRAAQE